MTQFLLSVYYPEGATQPPPAELEQIIRDTEVFHEEAKAAGVWVFGGGLHDASSATVVNVRGGQVLTTDGPFAETKEQLGGFSVLDLPDLDAALAWAEKASRATTCPIEVRPFQNGAGT
ncbi:MAG TPA: YciI family protein [Egibacteraceae bacterium]|jgi:hypothetical protein|nr:YciI family protein [Egibacteraceae bacterium]